MIHIGYTCDVDIPSLICAVFVAISFISASLSFLGIMYFLKYFLAYADTPDKELKELRENIVVNLIFTGGTLFLALVSPSPVILALVGGILYLLYLGIPAFGRYIFSYVRFLITGKRTTKGSSDTSSNNSTSSN
jgi:hypothetical protein